MPTLQELEDLVNNCDWTPTTLNGVKGCVVNGKGSYISASIFLPCACYDYGSDDYRAPPLGLGLYWSSVPMYSGWAAGNLEFGAYGDGDPHTSLIKRYYGLSVRPVTD